RIVAEIGSSLMPAESGRNEPGHARCSISAVDWDATGSLERAVRVGVRKCSAHSESGYLMHRPPTGSRHATLVPAPGTISKGSSQDNLQSTDAKGRGGDVTGGLVSIWWGREC